MCSSLLVGAKKDGETNGVACCDYYFWWRLARNIEDIDEKDDAPTQERAILSNLHRCHGLFDRLLLLVVRLLAFHNDVFTRTLKGGTLLKIASSTSQSTHIGSIGRSILMFGLPNMSSSRSPEMRPKTSAFLAPRTAKEWRKIWRKFNPSTIRIALSATTVLRTEYIRAPSTYDRAWLCFCVSLVSSRDVHATKHAWCCTW